MSDLPESDGADATKIAAVTSDLSVILAQLGKSADPVLALKKIRHQDRRKMQRQYLRLLKTKFNWWQVVGSPIHFWMFKRERQRVDVAAISSLNWNDVHRLNRLLSRIEFGFYLETGLAGHFRRLVRDGILTSRDVWRLLHSLGCHVKEDRVEPAHLARSVAWLGLVGGSIFGLIALLFAIDIVNGFVSGCEEQLCQILGSGMLCAWLLFIAPLLICCSWGRRDAANALHALLDLEPGFPAASRPAFKRPLLARLVW